MTTHDQDELHAAAVRSALDALNKAIGAAWNDGLTVSVSVLEIGYATCADQLPIVSAEVARPV